MKKLELNKKIIAQLDTPEKVLGGATVEPSLHGPPQTCANLDLSCAGHWTICGGRALNQTTMSVYW